jgi:arylsulfatase A-like enzyme
MDGRSLLDPGWSRDRLLAEFWHVGRVPTWASVVTARYQYVEYYADDATRVVFREYYDLQEDPWELENLLGSGLGPNRPDVPALHALLVRDRACLAATCP